MSIFYLIPLIIAATILQRTWRGVRRIEASQMITLSLVSSMVQTKPNTEVDMLNNFKKAKKIIIESKRFKNDMSQLNNQLLDDLSLEG